MNALIICTGLMLVGMLMTWNIIRHEAKHDKDNDHRTDHDHGDQS